MLQMFFFIHCIISVKSFRFIRTYKLYINVYGLVTCHIPETKRNINHSYFVLYYILYTYI